MKRSKLVAFFVAAVAAAPALADLRLSVGAEYTTGKYGGTESTDILHVPVIAKYETGPWALKLTVPYVRISGPANVVAGGEEVIALPGASAGRRTESGLGDMVASAFYLVKDERDASYGLDLGVKVKLGTADEAKGLGTGENDWSVQADVYKPLGAAFTAFATLGYRVYGDPPGLDLRNVPYGALGASYRVSAVHTVGAAWDYRPRIVTGGSAISEASAFWSVRMSPAWKLQIYGIAGFSDASPDAGAGALLEHRF